MGDGIDAGEVLGRHVAQVHRERLDVVWRPREVALVEQAGVETDHVVAGIEQHGYHLDPDVAKVSSH